MSHYISLERLIEENKEDYYRVLGECSNGWHEGKNEIPPWWNFFLRMVRSGYKDFESQIALVQQRATWLGEPCSNRLGTLPWRACPLSSQCKSTTYQEGAVGAEGRRTCPPLWSNDKNVLEKQPMPHALVIGPVDFRREQPFNEASYVRHLHRR